MISRWILAKQSNEKLVTKFLTPLLSTEGPKRDFLLRQISQKMGPDYKFDKVAIEYNCWLIFRFFVDLILWNDFTAYFMFAFKCIELPAAFGFLEIVWYLFGIVLVVLCYYIKIDALRVVKDYAWYWGDFFFLVDGELNFDGVFQIAPHPMYSIGYLGYYGTCILTRSFPVLYMSLLGHMCQFIFLVAVENPHIEKTYNTLVDSNQRREPVMALHKGPQAFFRRDAITVKNMNLLRAPDLLTIVLIAETAFSSLFLPPLAMIAHCVLWRLVHTVGLGILLHKQSTTKWFTRGFIKLGGSSRDAFNSWKSIYNASLTMTHLTFFLTFLKFSELPDLSSGSTLLRCIVGLLFIALHLWTAFEIFDVIKEYGWFYGDFFIIPGAALCPEYSGIYRFLNNPEKVLGHAAFYGMALMSDSVVVWVLAVLSQAASIAFITLVESPHMQRVYGEELRAESGAVVAIKDKVMKIKTIRKLDKGFDGAVRKLREATSQIKERVPDVKVKDKIDSVKDSLRSVAGDVVYRVAKQPDASTRRHYSLSLSKAGYSLGEPIVVKWAAPAEHSAQDWIAVYRQSANPSDRATNISSRGLWQWIQSKDQKQGTIEFAQHLLPWQFGVYEVRMHFDGHHGVVALSAPFEIMPAPPFQEINSDSSDEAAVSAVLGFTKAVFGLDEGSLDTSFSTMPHHDAPTTARAVTNFIRTVFRLELSERTLHEFPTPRLLIDVILLARRELGESGLLSATPTKKDQ